MPFYSPNVYCIVKAGLFDGGIARPASKPERTYAYFAHFYPRRMKIISCYNYNDLVLNLSE